MAAERPPRCYRCGADASVKYMALDYCPICRMVVVELAWLIPLGAPWGFPGAKGYMPEEEDPMIVLKRDEPPRAPETP